MTLDPQARAYLDWAVENALQPVQSLTPEEARRQAETYAAELFGAKEAVDSVRRARVAGVPFPIGGGPTAVKTVDALREFALQNKKLGYDGFYTPSVKYWPNSKEAVAAANEVFTPTKQDVDIWLQRYPNLEHPRMRERVELVGGTLAVESAPGRGTTVFARVPLPAGGGGQP